MSKKVKEKEGEEPGEESREGKRGRETVPREAFGIEALDKALEGGLPRGTWTVITGEPGTGKSILCMHFAWNGLEAGEPVIYVTTETSFRDVVRQASQFGMDFTKYEPVNLADILAGRAKASEEASLVVIDLFGLYRQYREMVKEAGEEGRKPSRALSIEVLKGAIGKAYEVLGFEEGKVSEPTRLIVDSMTAFWADKPAMARAYSYNLRQSLYRQNITAVLVSQYAPTTEMSFGFGLEHIADGIIHLWMDNVQETKTIRRWLIIKKMRLTNHAKNAFQIDIQPGKGFTIIQGEEG